MILAEYDVISYGNEQYVMLDRKSTQIIIDVSVRTSLGDNFLIIHIKGSQRWIGDRK